MDVLLCNSRLLIWLFLPRYGRHEMTLGHSFSGQHWPLLRSPPCVQDYQWIPTTVQCCASHVESPKLNVAKLLIQKEKLGHLVDQLIYKAISKNEWFSVAMNYSMFFSEYVFVFVSSLPNYDYYFPDSIKTVSGNLPSLSKTPEWGF